MELYEIDGVSPFSRSMDVIENPLAPPFLGTDPLG